MRTQTLHQGGQWPARIPAITVVHPGLQVHSIAAPKTDRRLSFLMSANLYCAFAAGLVLMAQASPALLKPPIRTMPDLPVVEIRPMEEPPSIVPAVAPPVLNSMPGQSSTANTLTETQPDPGVPATPTDLGSNDVSAHIASTQNTGPGTSRVPGNGTLPPSHIGDPGAGQPMEVTASAVSILRQIQPVYPVLARMAHKEGDVVLLMTINEMGIPTEVRMDSGDSIFKADAIRAAQQWRFTPARLDGQPHAARFRLTLQFRLRG